MIYDCNYLSYVVAETLRLDASVPFSSRLTITEDVTLECGYKLKQGHSFAIHIHYLHHNPSQWITPEEFIPERFDPTSPYYLTPDGKKRHPMSYGPFLGGRRICLGKTFGENIGKCIIALI